MKILRLLRRFGDIDIICVGGDKVSADLKAEDVNFLCHYEKEMHDKLYRTFNMWFNDELPDDYPCEECINDLYDEYAKHGGRTAKRVIIAQALIDSYMFMSCKSMK